MISKKAYLIMIPYIWSLFGAKEFYDSLMDVIKDCWHKEVRIYDHTWRSACSSLKDGDIEYLTIAYDASFNVKRRA